MNYFRITILNFTVGLIFSTISFAQTDTRPSATWQVQKYDISATLPQDEKDRSLTVKAVLTLMNVSSAPAMTD